MAPETIVSMYMPHRKRRKLGAALLRLDRLQLILLSMLLLVAILSSRPSCRRRWEISRSTWTDWSFTAGASVSTDNGGFKDATARLKAATVQDANEYFDQ